MKNLQDKTIQISDHGDVQVLSYEELLKYHKGDSFWGLSVAFRALQIAAKLLSENNCWDRKDLFIVSKHPGPGVKDAIEFVTKCISRDQFKLTKAAEQEISCSSKMEYEWEIYSDTIAIKVALRNDFVPKEFYDLLERLNTKTERSEDKQNFYDYKINLVEKVWSESITSSFLVNKNLPKMNSIECINQ